jgi:hypothetical protein
MLCFFRFFAIRGPKSPKTQPRIIIASFLVHGLPPSPIGLATFRLLTDDKFAVLCLRGLFCHCVSRLTWLTPIASKHLAPRLSTIESFSTPQGTTRGHPVWRLVAYQRYER